VRRTALGLAAVLAVLVGVHMAYRNTPVSLPTIGLPAVHIALRGQVTAVGNQGITVNLEDPQGELTGVLRQVTVTGTTRVVWSGSAATEGTAALKTVRPGYRVAVRGQNGPNNTVVAQVLVVGLPPVTGTLTALQNGQLTIAVPGQKAPVVVQLTSRTAFFVPGGEWQRLAQGAPVRVLVRLQPDGTLLATAVMVRGPAGGS
jgi:hypothetical protein